MVLCIAKKHRGCRLDQLVFLVNQRRLAGLAANFAASQVIELPDLIERHADKGHLSADTAALSSLGQAIHRLNAFLSGSLRDSVGKAAQ